MGIQANRALFLHEIVVTQHRTEHVKTCNFRTWPKRTPLKLGANKVLRKGTQILFH